MNRRIRTRLVIIALLTTLSLYLFVGFPPSISNIKDRIHLGLDLKGGIHLVLQVVTDDAVQAETDRAIESIRAYLRKENIRIPALARTQIDTFSAMGIDRNSEAQFRDAIARVLPDWNMNRLADPAVAGYSVSLRPNRVLALRSEAVDQTINVIRNRIDKLGVTEPVIQKQGGTGTYEVVVQLPGFDDPQRVKEIIQVTAVLELKLVESGPYPSESEARASHEGALPDDLEVLLSKEPGQRGNTYYIVHRTASVSGRDLKDAFLSRDGNGHPAVGFNLATDAAQRFAQVTEQNIGKRLAIVLDKQIQSVASIHTRILDSGIIEGGPAGFAPQEAKDLALILRSGALPASVKYLEEGKVSASLGADSIRSGVLASTVALAAVVAFMLFYYRLSGLNATVAMILNVVILLGAIAYFGITLTLPGIAGVTLTIGVGIDSNVLIFERIREEIRAGKTAVAAVAAGFNRVFITLIDTHLAALISAVFLFLFGTGPIKGFAVTLVIGLVSNIVYGRICLANTIRIGPGPPKKRCEFEYLNHRGTETQCLCASVVISIAQGS